VGRVVGDQSGMTDERRAGLLAQWAEGERYVAGDLPPDKDVYPFLEHYADRTPGSFVEEKEFSLVWHYRMSDPEFGEWLANELAHELEQMLADTLLRAAADSSLATPGMTVGADVTKRDEVVKSLGPYSLTSETFGVVIGAGRGVHDRGGVADYLLTFRAPVIESCGAR
jgi:hypothetical protein